MRKRYLFCQKWYEMVLKDDGLVLAAEPPCINFIEHPPDNHMNVFSLAYLVIDSQKCQNSLD